ncbi:MAG: hopanoid biosynthesis-associated transporter HpnN [Geobacteraceae bacterium]|nr:hopanoid biosynthesis-associated transporter HpnN [Geobacteraceae bacterium]
MIERTRTFFIRLFGAWVDFIGRNSLLVLFLSLLATVGAVIYTVNHFRIDTEMTDMISDKLPYRKLEKEFQSAFPQFKETIVVVIDADTPEAARIHTGKIAARLREERRLFKGVFAPGSGEFFEKNGLLYLSVKDLDALSENLANAQPLLGLISKDLTLRGLFSVVERMVSQEGDIEQKIKIVPFFDRLAQVLEGSASNRPIPLSWQELVLGEEMAAAARRQFIILDPILDYATFSGGEAHIEAIHRIKNELGLHKVSGVRVRLTGEVVLNYENLLAVNKGMGLATLISFLLVAIALVIGLRSGKLVFDSLVTLLVGFIWTLGFAIAFVGRLNLISVAFGVLFIGLGIDYAIQYCVRYRELMASGLGHHEAIVGTAKGLGVSLLVCTLAAAIGFYSFLPTPYTGVSELGLIAGTGMLINLFATLTVLPALLTLLPLKKTGMKEFVSARPLYRVPYKYAKAVVVGTIAIGIGAAFFVPKLYFDYNPLNLYDPHSDAVVVIKELFRNEMTSPWTISILTGSAKEAEETAGKLKGLKEVKEAITLASFIPEDQSSKLAILSDIALFMPPGLETQTPEKLSFEKNVASLESLESSLKKLLSAARDKDGIYATSVSRLHRSLEGFKKALAHPENGKKAFDKLDESVLSHLPNLFHDLQTSLRASVVQESDLPRELRLRYVTTDGRYRVEVFPRENILQANALKKFVEAVSNLAPNATDTPVTIRGAGNAVVRSFLLATLYAFLVITLFMLIELKSVSDTVLVLLPLVLSLLMTGAASVILDIPFNFANVIVIPLLLGTGVEVVYFIHRFRTDPPPSGNMLETSTARALFFSALTTILSFSTLSFSPHRGMASMGKLLTLCMGFYMVATFIFLPAVLKFVKPRERNSGPRR